MRCRAFRSWLTAFVLAGFVSPSVTSACDTPVFRYAMYRWRPAPFEVYYFHKEPPDEADKAIHKSLLAAAEQVEQPLNVLFQAVNVNSDPELKSVPPDVRKSWLAQPSPSLPTYLVVTPNGAAIFAGSFDDATVAAMSSSPLRQKLAAELALGKACVFLLLTNGDEQGDNLLAPAAAEKLIGAVLHDMSAGKLNLYNGLEEAAPSRQPDDPERPQPEASYLKLARNDPAEQWLVRSLLAVEDGLTEETQPLVFAVFGRGRALPPFIGKGISRDNLLDCLAFVTGACSCTAKDLNPGMDLLVQFDWDTAAQKVAEKFGTEEGNERFRSEDLFSELTLPAGSKTKGQGEEPSPAELPSATAPADDEPATDDAVAASETANSGRTTVDKPRSRAAITSARNLAEASKPAAPTSVFVVAAGIGIAFIALFLATLVVLRPR